MNNFATLSCEGIIHMKRLKRMIMIVLGKYTHICTLNTTPPEIEQLVVCMSLVNDMSLTTKTLIPQYTIDVLENNPQTTHLQHIWLACHLPTYTWLSQFMVFLGRSQLI